MKSKIFRVFANFARVVEYYQVGRVPDIKETETYVRDYVLGSDSDVSVMMAFDGDTGIGLASFSIMYPSPNLKGQLYLKELYVDENTVDMVQDRH